MPSDLKRQSGLLSDPRRSVVRVNIEGGPHAPNHLPRQQRRQEHKQSGDRRTQQNVEDPVPAVDVAFIAFGVGHCRPPSVKAASSLHLACGPEPDLPTMGTETSQLVPAVSVDEYPKVPTLRGCSLTYLTLANRADTQTAHIRVAGPKRIPKTLPGECARQDNALQSSPIFPGISGNPAALSVCSLTAHAAHRHGGQCRPFVGHLRHQTPYSTHLRPTQGVCDV